MECYSILFCVLSFVCAAISCKPIEFRWTKNSEFDDVTMTQNVAGSIHDVKVVYQCMMHCVNEEQCLSVSYNSEERTCKLYSVNRFDIEISVTSTGSRYYSMLLGDCPAQDGFVLLRDVGLCFKLFTRTKQWNQAREDCNSIASRLIVVDTEEKNSAVTNYLRSISETENILVAIGLTDQKHEGVFVWENGNNLTFSNWLPGEPSNAGGHEDCVLLGSEHGRWNDYICWQSFNYMCEIPVSL